MPSFGHSIFVQIDCPQGTGTSPVHLVTFKSTQCYNTCYCQLVIAHNHSYLYPYNFVDSNWKQTKDNTLSKSYLQWHQSHQRIWCKLSLCGPSQTIHVPYGHPEIKTKVINIERNPLFEMIKLQFINHTLELDFINSLWPCDAIWPHRSGSILTMVMACCLTAPSHCLNQCWLIIR